MIVRNKIISLRFTTEEHDTLKELANSLDITKSELIRNLIKEYSEKENN